jgi:hypothetical protein
MLSVKLVWSFFLHAHLLNDYKLIVVSNLLKLQRQLMQSSFSSYRWKTALLMIRILINSCCKPHALQYFKNLVQCSLSHMSLPSVKGSYLGIFSPISEVHRTKINFKLTVNLYLLYLFSAFYCECPTIYIYPYGISTGLPKRMPIL